jgi:uncharacterized protein YxeA
MKKKLPLITILISTLLLGALYVSNQSTDSNLNIVQSSNTSSSVEESTKEIDPICDGTVVTANCKINDISYTTYIYHPAVAEKSHTETVKTYKKVVTGYCTLCNDGTYSPSCATGRGACSHHGGVAEWNAAKYSTTPEYNTKTVIDTPAQEAYYEKVLK